MKTIAFIDSEIASGGKRIEDIGAIRNDRSEFHSPDVKKFIDFISPCEYICGHNIVAHDMKYLASAMDGLSRKPVIIDTLYMSPLLFPKKPYHKLLKDDKLETEELNNPLSDAKKAKALFYDEINAFSALPDSTKRIYCALLSQFPEFQGFFSYVDFNRRVMMLESFIKREFDGKICTNAPVGRFIRENPKELAYALANIGAADRQSITPPWVSKNFPKVTSIMEALRDNRCPQGCRYCRRKLDVRAGLKDVFGFDEFRTFNGEPLQEMSADAAIRGQSLLSIFPTGGGKSIAFQLPAIMLGEAVNGLTVVISPLQSLMKDQVDNLEKSGLMEAATINGLLNPIERADAIRRVADGSVSLLYIAPEQLRSRTIEKLLLQRNVIRFVIDEAHCFSAWGQDFRVDYLYIGDFIKALQDKKGLDHPIPVSCFTATAKQKVISDIRDYFRNTLNLNLTLYASDATRENLRYYVIHVETEEEKYPRIRALILSKKCPTIVYTSRVKSSHALAEKLNRDGIVAAAYNGKMDAQDKIEIQDRFMRDDIQVIVATSAFGMGVDKKNVGLVIHYDISNSLEDYVQEAGRGGRDPQLYADCYVLYNDSDLNKHFMLLNQSKLSFSEIQQVWKAIKELTKTRGHMESSALNIARQAGWSTDVDVETKVKTAISALESAGYVKRMQNSPAVYATGISVKSMIEAGQIIDASPLNGGDDTLRNNAKRVIQRLISDRAVSKAGNRDAETRVDYLADVLGLEMADVVDAVEFLRQTEVLADTKDMTAFISKSDSKNKTSNRLTRFSKLEQFLLGELAPEGICINYKQLNDKAQNEGITDATVKNIKTIIRFWIRKHYISKPQFSTNKEIVITPALPIDDLKKLYQKRMELCAFISEELHDLAALQSSGSSLDTVLVHFSEIELLHEYRDAPKLSDFSGSVELEDIETALLYLNETEAIKLEGGFLVIYNRMTIHRLQKDNRIQYKKADYSDLNEYYKQKIQQIHIIGAYANLMVRDQVAAQQFVADYFQMEYKKFIAKYFKDKEKVIERNITAGKYDALFGELSERQSEIIQDKDSKFIVVSAGPGSGKTRVLVHKLASLLLMEDVKHEQLLMLTFSRAAATEFKHRLIGLISQAAFYDEVKTFHSYCFDLIGRTGNEGELNNVVAHAVEMIDSEEIETNRIAKTVVVIDEAQDMDENEFALVERLIAHNDELRVIAVGDDDQNIYEFRGSDSRFFRAFIDKYQATQYNLLENYRSKKNIVDFANAYARTISSRMKSAPIESVAPRSSENDCGRVEITYHSGSNPEYAVVKQICENGYQGKVCVLTYTNEEAMTVMSLLLRNNIPSKLIQSNDGFDLFNLGEIRFFTEVIDKTLSESQSPLISEDLWAEAKSKLIAQYRGSASLELCLNLLDSFEKSSGRKYRSDFEEFVRESHIEDFYTDDRETVMVSTIHKAKGREFDSVYMVLNNVVDDEDEKKRMLYVGITRAKSGLFIHCNNDLFRNILVPSVVVREDRASYPQPDEIILQLSLRDVFIGYFKNRRNLVSKVRSGDALKFNDGILTWGSSYERPLIKLSRACDERIKALAKKGYTPVSAKIRYCVWYRGKDMNGIPEEEEVQVVLPDITLRKERT